MTDSHLVAVVLAALGAVLFGLSAVRQHRAVQDTAVRRGGRGLGVRALVDLARHPGWLLGSLQGVAGGAAHLGALALAPITLVQPIGVLAVPVTVLGSAVALGRRPARPQVVGSACAVAGVTVLTLLLLQPPAHHVLLPAWWLPAAVVLGATAVTAAVMVSAVGRPLARSMVLAVAAAVLFGLEAVLLRTIGTVVASHAVTAHLPLLLAAAVGVGLALPVGLWAMQSAYLSGSAEVVLCCLALVDPVAAVLAGRLLLHDGVAASGPALVGALGCTVVAGVGVLLLSRGYVGEGPQPGPVPVAGSGMRTG